MSSTKVSDEEHAHEDSAERLEKERRDETRTIVCLSVCGVLGLGALIGLIILLCSIHHLGPEEQVVVTGPTGKYVRNGPTTVVLRPERHKVWRQPIKLAYMEYARVKNTQNGHVRHEVGPQFLFLGAFDVLERTDRLIILQRQQYIRLIDKLTGAERVVRGPRSLMPEPFEQFPAGVEEAEVLGIGKAAIVVDKITGLKRLVTQEGLYVPEPYVHVVEIRMATVLGIKEYAVVLDNLSGERYNELGPQLFQAKAYESIVQVSNKVILRKYEFMQLKNKRTGHERVVRGPAAFAPHPAEEIVKGKKQKAFFVNTDSAIVVLNRTSGQQRLVTERTAFFPGAYEEVLETRALIRLLPQESVGARNAGGKVNVYNGMTTPAFFLPPFWNLFEMEWSSYSESVDNMTGTQEMKNVAVTKVDRRSRKMLFWYDLRTSDNVELRLGGVVFWKVSNVTQMIRTTPDPSGDVWHHARSSLMQSVGKTTFHGFMTLLDTVAEEAFQELLTDGFLTERGVLLEALEVTSYDCVRNTTAKILEEIIKESTMRVNRLQKEESKNEVRAANLTAQYQLERQRKQLIISRATNAKLTAGMKGDVAGMKRLSFAKTFIGGLNLSVPDLDDRVELYKLQQTLKSHNNITHILAESNAKMFLKKQDVGVAFNNLNIRGSEL